MRSVLLASNRKTMTQKKKGKRKTTQSWNVRVNYASVALTPPRITFRQVAPSSVVAVMSWVSRGGAKESLRGWERGVSDVSLVGRTAVRVSLCGRADRCNSRPVWLVSDDNGYLLRERGSSCHVRFNDLQLVDRCNSRPVWLVSDDNGCLLRETYDLRRVNSGFFLQRA